MSKKNIVILGGGIGGIVAANELRRHLGRDHRIVIVDKNRIHALGLSFLWIMVGWRKAYTIEKHLSLLEKKGIEFLHAAVTGINMSAKRIETEKGSLAYDYLIVSLGAEYGWDVVPGLDTNVHTFYTLQGAEEVHRRLAEFEGGTIAIVLASVPYKCPPAPYEAAMLIDSYLRRKSIRAKTSIDVFIPEPAPMQIAGPEAAKLLQGMLEMKEITLNVSHRLRSFNSVQSSLDFENGSHANADLAIFIPPHRSPKIVRDAGLTNQSGWIPVHRLSLRTTHENVFAIGDVTTIPLSNGMSLPKAGIFALSEAEIVAHNIAHEIIDGKKERTFEGTGYCFIEIGDGKAGHVSGEFFADPSPKVTFREPSSASHWGKVVFEKYWLWRWF